MFSLQEIQQEIVSLQHQLQMAEEQLRVYEPDPLRFTSMAELKSCEKHLVEILANVAQRKEYILSNHLSSYDPSPIQGFSSTVYNPLLQGNISNVDPHSIGDQCHVSNPSAENFPSWPQPFASTGLQSSPLPPTFYSHVQHGMAGSEMPEMIPNDQQMEIFQGTVVHMVR
ncbi:hypothetical protein DITRI_Ditri05aG0128400 [Diplodiscus trichospermus]